MNLFSLIKPLVFALPPETAHNLAKPIIKSALLKVRDRNLTLDLKQDLAGLTFKHPLGLAAGFDKNAELLNGLNKLGFSFIEAGTVTPKAQPGNPKPRVFRLTRDQAIINRFGFNNCGRASATTFWQKII